MQWAKISQDNRIVVAAYDLINAFHLIKRKWTEVLFQSVLTNGRPVSIKRPLKNEGI